MEKREELLKKLPRYANVQELYQLLKYEKEVNQMAALAGNRTKYREMVGILRSMKKIGADQRRWKGSLKTGREGSGL